MRAAAFVALLICLTARAEEEPNKIFDIPRVERIIVDGDSIQLVGTVAPARAGSWLESRNFV